MIRFFSFMMTDIIAFSYINNLIEYELERILMLETCMSTIKQKTDLNLDVIIQTIRDEKCILCVGPELFIDEQGLRLEDQIAQYLQITDNPNVQNYYASDGMFLFPSEEGRTAIYYALRKFYQGPFPNAQRLFEKIAQIPFHLIFSITPDFHLEEAYQNLNLKYKSDFYWKNRTPSTKIRRPSSQSPLIYNMFGSIRELDSLVLTYQDLFDYFDSILGARSMPEDLKNIVHNTHDFIFLGIPFEKWYMQLLLRILAKYNDKKRFLRHAASQELEEQIKIFCEEQFRIIFIEDDIESFVERLFAECEQSGIIKKPDEKTESPINQVTKLLSNAKMPEAIEELTNFLESFGDAAEELLDELIVLDGRFHRLQRRMRIGSIDDRDAEVRQNQLTETLLGIVDKARDFE